MLVFKPGHVIEQKCFDERGAAAVEPWTVKRVLGSGGFSTVYEVFNRHQQPLACKVVSKERLKKSSAK